MSQNVKERIIKLLHNYQGQFIPQSFIHRVIGVSKSRVSEVLSELEREGLISRSKVGNVKIVYVNQGLSAEHPERSIKQLKLGVTYSSEYLFLGGFVKKMKQKGINVEVVIFKDGLEATRSLANGSVDLALSPLISQLYVLPAYRTYRVVVAGLKGGFRVLYRGDAGTVYSSMISTMDYLRSIIIAKGLINADRTVYYHGADQMLRISRGGGYVVTWHPLYKRLIDQGFKVVYGPRDIDIGFCCALGVSNTLGLRTQQLLKKLYIESIEEYEKNPDRYVEYYSLITGIDNSTLKDALSDYTVADNDGPRTVNRILSELKISIPSPSVYQGFIE